MRYSMPIILVALLMVAPAMAAPAMAAPSSDQPSATQTQGQTETLSVGHLGVGVTGLSQELRVYFGAPTNSGVLVSQVEPGSAAENAGLEVGDVIVDLDGQAIASPQALVDAIVPRGGQGVRIGIMRHRSRMELTGQVTSRPVTGQYRLEVVTPEGERYVWGVFEGEGDIEPPQAMKDWLEDFDSVIGGGFEFTPPIMPFTWHFTHPLIPESLRHRIEAMEQRMSRLERGLEHSRTL